MSPLLERLTMPDQNQPTGAEETAAGSKASPSGSPTPSESSGTERHQTSEFESEAETPSPGLVTEFWWFICENKAWWLVPLLLALLLIGAIVWLSGSAVAPFIYPLF